MIFQTFLQSKKWQHKDAAVRLEAIAELHHPVDPNDEGAEDAATVLATLAKTDSAPAVRLAALALVRDIDVVRELLAETDADIANAALMQYCRIVSGAVPSRLSDEDRLATMQQMTERPALLAVLHDCGSDAVGLATLARLQTEFALDTAGLLDIAAHSNNHTVRYAAAVQIEDPALLKQLSTLVGQKDRAVLKLCKERLQQVQDAEDKRAADAAMALHLCENVESLAGKVIGALSQAQYEYSLSQWQEVSAQADDALQARFSAACAALEARLQAHALEQQQRALQQRQFADLTAGCEAAETALQALTAPLDATQIDSLEQQHHALEALRHDTLAVGGGDPASLERTRTMIESLSRAVRAFHALETKQADLLALEASLATLSPKNTAALAAIAARLHRLFDQDAWPANLPASELYGRCLALQASVEKLKSRNQAYLEKLHKDSLAHIAALEQHIEAGQVNDAQRMWDKVQGAIKNGDAALKKTLEELLAPFKPRLTELVDWKNFAAAQKKKALIEQMQALDESTLHIADKAKKIKALQDEWKTLGHSAHNDALWTQFNKAAHKAFEPCKEYFRERKAKLQTNLEARVKICEELEALAKTLSPENLNVASLNKAESKAMDDWKLYAPVEQAKIKKLQKRFNTVLGDIRAFKRKVLQGNAAQKLDLIAAAVALKSHEDIQEAMAQAKQLQAQWKTIGPSQFKDDRKHWEAFRAACDKIFARRKEEAAAARPQRSSSGKAPAAVSPAVAAAREVLQTLRTLVGRSSEELVSARREFTELKERFGEHLKEDLRHEKRALQEQFDKLSKQFEAKLKAAPDKKSLQMIGQAKAKAEFLETLERAALAGKGSEADMDALSDQWQSLGRVSDLKQEQALEQRFQSLYQQVDKAALKRQAKENEEKAREVCIAAEIVAGVESPDTDKALRMQVQLKQLKQSFGSRDSKSPAQQISDLEVQLLCIGPLESAVRESLTARLLHVRSKV